MNDPIKILEQRVQRAVARIRQLSAERERLERELEAARARRTAGEDSPGAAEGGWRGERAQIVGELRKVVAQLRGD